MGQRVRLVIYLRVSTAAQAEDGLGLDVQEGTARQWAGEHDHDVVAVLADRAVSGRSELDERVGLIDAIRSLREGEADGLLVYRLDRLARDLVIQEQILAEIWRSGGHVLSAAGGEAHYLEDDPRDPSRKLIRQVLGAVAEYERSMIALRLQSGRRRKAETGGFAFGSPRYGWRSEDGQLVHAPEEQAAIARMRELASEGASLRAIADRLTIEGHHPKRGRRWWPSAIARALKT
jgi:DNA invertase Pin-like site-specific DNA recombinase